MNNDPLKKIPPPISETNGSSIHLSYIRRDIDEMKINHKEAYDEIKRNLVELKTQYPTRSEFTDFKDYIGVREKELVKEAGNEHAAIHTVINDHETRLRATEELAKSTKTQIKTWGTAMAVILGGLQIIQIALNLKNH